MSTADKYFRCRSVYHPSQTSRWTKSAAARQFLLILNHLESNTAALSLDLWMNAVILTSLVSQLCCELVRGRFAADVHEATCEQHACVTWYRLAIIDPNDSLLPLASLMAELVFFHSRPQVWSCCCCCCCIRSQFSEICRQLAGWPCENTKKS